MTPVLSIEALSAGYGGRMILQDVSLQVHPGEIMTIIGHNGAGKSTLLRAIFNLVPARTGRVLLAQRDVWGLPSDRLLMAGIAYIPQHRSVFPRLTIEENLQMGGYLVRDRTVLAERIDRVLDLFPILKARAGQFAGMMSGGEQRMLEIARTLLQDPKLIMLDEPSIGLAPKMVDAVFDNVRLLREQGKAILMVEQNVKKALSISDRGGVMELGTLRIQDRASRLIDDERVARLYLGKR
ncbi:MAG: ABC transporter ATP-binding protein [Comamonadaceae bacterium]|jgi:ABC-type branched-subunit amino acid transport system ATPase component|nr:ABC transporter ATP-binding protein [Comamonadaceae bacterium]